MSTRSNIALKLRDCDLNQTFQSSCGIEVSPKGKGYLQVYCHFDGYPEGVGADLLSMNMTYEQALEYILEGDRSTTRLSYYEMRHEECPPKAMIAPICKQEYLYILEEVDKDAPVHIKCTSIYSDTSIDLQEFIGQRDLKV